MPVDVAIVVADGARPSRAALDVAWPGWDRGRQIVVAADGGAGAAVGLGLTIDLVVGDMDSVAPELLATLQAEGVAVEAWPRDKDASDTELALRSAIGHEPARIVILGATGGGRLDHALANVALLGLAELADREVSLLDDATRLRLATGPSESLLDGRLGDLVSLLPVGADAVGVRTDGLAFPLLDETLAVGSTRGLSNVRTATTARVRVAAGRLLIVEVVRPEEVHR